VTADESAARPPAYHQEIRVESGVGYGVVGADLHVFGDGVPLYLLENWRDAPAADPAWLRELPSRMLNARFAVVDFTGRRGELAQLREWRETGSRLGVRWLHGPGGAGKTRLAAQFASESAAENWKVVTATHGPGTLLPMLDSQDLRPGRAAGLLLIVDYADRWPLTHLVMLLSNRLFRQSEVRTRVLLLARTADDWPRVRAELVSEQPGTSSQFLEPLPENSAQREQMFAAARDGFARHYEPADLRGLDPPAPLDHPDFALTLALHMAALVAVDARVAGCRTPRDMAGLTIYLLDREHDHWARLYGDGTHELNLAERTFVTPPAAMNQAVFTAALTGPVGRPAGTAVLDSLELSLDPARVLTDHRYCYPPAESSSAVVLEPLYPDRLAEDFLALTIRGHAADYPDQPWAASTASSLLARSGERDAPAAWTPRAITFLEAAAGRWPHVGVEYLYPLLHTDPRLALDAGGAALSSLADLADAPASLFEAIEPHLPPHRDADLDVGVAAITRRLTVQRLAVTSQPQQRASLHAVLAQRQLNAGLRAEALEAGRAAAEIWRSLAESDPGAHRLDLAVALAQLSTYRTEMGQRKEALDAAMEAVVIWKRLADTDPARYGFGLASALQDAGIALAAAGRSSQALAAAEKALEILRRLVKEDPTDGARWLARSLINVGAELAKAGQWNGAADRTAEALGIYRGLAESTPARYEPDVAGALSNLSGHMRARGDWSRALAAADEAVSIQRGLAKKNPAAHEPELARQLSSLGGILSDLGRRREALAAGEEALDIRRRLAAAIPAAHDPDLALSLHNRALYLARLDRREEALPAAGQAVAIWRRLALGDPAAFGDRLAHSLSGLAADLAELGRDQEALTTAEESAAIYRRLASENPDYHAAQLAMSLANLGGYAARLGRTAEGLDLTVEAVDTYRSLAAAYPAVHEPDFAAALTKLGRRSSQLGDADRAVSAFEESAAIYRRLAAANPVVFDSELAQVLRNLSPELDKQGQHAKAADIEREAVATLRRLAAGDRAKWEAKLAGALSDLGVSLATSGRPRDAVPLAREAIAIFRPLAAADPGTHREHLARARLALVLARAKGGWRAPR
jgi:Tetratricopeptide repeat